MKKADKPDHRTLMLEAAQTLMLTRGFPATSVDDICAAAGVTKGSFYYHFASKDELALALVETFYLAIEEALFAHDLGPVSEPKTRIDRFFEATESAVKGSIWKNGCLMGSFALELSQTHPQIREAIAQRFTALTDVLAAEFRRAAESTGRTVNPDALAQQFLASLEGSIILAKAHANGRYALEALASFRLCVNTLFGWA